MRYEIMWERDDMLPGEVQRAWEEGEPSQNLSDVATSLRRVMASLRRWSFDKFGGVTKELEAIRIKMEEFCSQDHIANQMQVDQLRDRMDELLYREEMMWLQRSSISWLKEGDRNMKFFHRKATRRAKKNKIKLLKKDNGEVTKEKKEMESMARDFFQQLYKADPNVQPEGLLHLIQPKITEEMNKELCKEVSDEEVGDALFQMGHLKAPGSDGFPARFFQKNWETMKKMLLQESNTSLHMGKCRKGLMTQQLCLF
jgi:hypothetical protein